VEEKETTNIRALFRETRSFGAEAITMLQSAIAEGQLSEVQQELGAFQSDVENATEPPMRDVITTGIGFYLLGDHEQADMYLARAGNEPLGIFYHALVLTALGRFEDAALRFQEAGSQGFDQVDCTLRRAGAIRAMGRLEEAESLLRASAAEGATRAEYSYQMGCILSDRGDTYGAVEYFERAVDMDSHHTRALFSLAGENSLRGNDDEAIRLYERCLAKPPQYVGALLNLGLLYEDAENYPAAAYCFRRVLDVDGTHERARLYLKDIDATSDMFYDEESARAEFRTRQVLDRPITDFELTVRSRNCLERIGMRTLEDLTRTTEQELLSNRNFGETSLTEVRELMSAHSLKVGQNAGREREQVTEDQLEDLTPEQRTLRERSVADLNLSVRARKCMTRLGITTLGGLIRRTADELLASKNFGVTSLNEVRAQLAELGLNLRND
jgi:DNA-directed RNA polymerase subunit alpha